MKNIIALIIIGVIYSQPVSLANCSTGFACSIKDLNKNYTQQLTKKANIVKNYFKKSDTIHFGNKKFISQNYRDLFLFHTSIN